MIGLWRNGWLSWLSFPVTWPVWALILLAFAGLAIACLALAVFYFVTKEASHLNKETSHLDYFSDDIFGVEWNWRYIRDQLDERELSAFCPNKQCACRLEPQLRSGAGAVDVVLLVCGHCGFSKGFEYDWRQLRRKVIIEIERRVRTREFKQRLEAHG